MNEASTLEGAFEQEKINTNYLIVKRGMDIIFGLIGVIFLVPVTIIIKLAYMLTGDFASIFYRQVRVGKNGKLIKIYKFRSMIKGADVVLKELLKQKNIVINGRKIKNWIMIQELQKLGKLFENCH